VRVVVGEGSCFVVGWGMAASVGCCRADRDKGNLTFAQSAP